MIWSFLIIFEKKKNMFSQLFFDFNNIFNMIIMIIIYWKNCYVMDSVFCFFNIYFLESEFFSELEYFERLDN